MTEPNHMTPDEFRAAGHEVIDWIANYMETVESLPVLSTSEPGEVRAKLPVGPPEEPEPFDQVLSDMTDIVVPGITHWQSPNFFAYFSANVSGPSILGELMSAGLGVQGMMWATSPACTELETHMCDWMVEACGLPDQFLSGGSGGGVIQDSASSATLCALLAARERAGGPARVADMCVYASNQVHSSFQKGAKIAGFTEDHIRLVGVDDSFALDPDALAVAIAADRNAGLVPTAIVATVGSTSSTAVDPVPAIAEVASAHDLWLHVDGAFAGSATVCPEFAHLNDGLDDTDSYAFNPHKWLLTNFDCTLMYVADRGPLLDALSILPEYLKNEASESGAVIDYRDWQVPLGRRFRALKLWFVLRHYGLSGLRAHIRKHVKSAQWLAEQVEADPDWELAAPVSVSLVCMRHLGGEEHNQRIVDQINSSGEAYLTHTVLREEYTIRFAIGAVATQQDHVAATWSKMREIANEIAPDTRPNGKR